MALPARGSGPMTLSMIAVELGKAATATVSLNDADARALANIPSGAISLDDFYGKARVAVTNPLSPKPSFTSAITAPATGGFIDFVLGHTTWWFMSAAPVQTTQYVTVGNANDLQAKITVTAGAAHSNPYSNWADISSSNTFVVRVPNGSQAVATATFTVEIRNKTTGVIVSTTPGCTMTLNPPTPAPVVKNPLNPVPSADGLSYNAQPTLTYFNLQLNGTYFADSDGDTTTANANGQIMVSGSVPDVEVRITPTSGTFTSNNAANWVSIVNGTGCNISQNSTGTKTTVFKVEFRNKHTQALISTTTGCTLVARVTGTQNPDV